LSKVAGSYKRAPNHNFLPRSFNLNASWSVGALTSWSALSITLSPVITANTLGPRLAFARNESRNCLTRFAVSWFTGVLYFL
jgi:hypothetical protein